MLTQVRMSVLGDDQYVRAFDAFAGEMRDLREPLTRIRDLVALAVTEQFSSEGSHGLGAGWKPLNPDYEKWKSEHFPNQPILQRTGAGHDILTDKHEATLELSAHRLIYGIPPGATNRDGENVAEYMARAQTGGADRHPPQRKIFALTYAERRQFDREIVAWLNGRRHALFGR